MRGRAKGEFQGTVLIADDHEVVRLGLVQLLRRSLRAKKIVESVCFESIITHLETSDVTLAIVDLGMPGLTGAGDLRRMRDLRPNARIVVLSGSTSRTDILNALAAGMHGYVVKSQTSEELIAKLRYVLSGEIYVPPILAELAHEPAPGTAPRRGAQLAARELLSSRQRQVLKGLVQGRSNKEIAQDLKIAEGTVKMHLASLFRALGATNRAHAAALGKQLVG
jgi:DNA-binding NarL/FixJ family response regulator